MKVLIRVKEARSTLKFVTKGMYTDTIGRLWGFGHCKSCNKKFDTFGLYEQLQIKLLDESTCYKCYKAETDRLEKAVMAEMTNEELCHYQTGMTPSEYQMKNGIAWNE